MFSLRCLIANQGLIPEISVPKYPKKIGRALDLKISFFFSCFTVGRTISIEFVGCFFSFSYTATCFKRMINLLPFVGFFFLS